MASFFDTAPDSIVTTGTGRHLQYHFTFFSPGTAGEVGTRQVVVYSPSRYNSTWRAVKFHRLDVAAYKPIGERELTADEIAHFKALIAEHEAQAVS